MLLLNNLHRPLANLVDDRSRHEDGGENEDRQDEHSGNFPEGCLMRRPPLTYHLNQPTREANSMMPTRRATVPPQTPMRILMRDRASDSFSRSFLFSLICARASCACREPSISMC